jgi:hypothetical protein
MGGESNFLFRFDPTSDARLAYVLRGRVEAEQEIALAAHDNEPLFLIGGESS